ncbi:GNAT family N-acetyltransferase [Limimaricola variabilis]|uniref:GNAT family N-acetyltransferase n=1 Tax=Limimaricola variabilis TaxID=1492771 RepID=UPI002AC8DC43|nr:GNAT family N-acetyltransferase [Limimaricola variabilis]WPY94540.1 GNAT family N-acetyltransferase [Limimaricola variabilis]
MQIRKATADDAASMSAVLAAVLAEWGSDRPRDVAHVQAHYVAHPASVLCSVAVDEGRVCGFQSLKRAWPGNPYDVTPGWGIIGTYMAPAARGRGLGRSLFVATETAARRAGLPAIDATIGASNASGLGYYEKLGFETYREFEGTICKRYVLDPITSRAGSRADHPR